MKFSAFEPIDFKNSSTDLDIVNLRLQHIIPDEAQARKYFDEAALAELAGSIKQHGVIQPIIVKKLNNERYQIIAGERRWRASAQAGLTMIPAIIHATTNTHQKNVAISLIENIQREALNPIELAAAYYQLSQDHGLSHEAIAVMVGKNRVTITNSLRLLKLSEFTRQQLIMGKIEMGHARALLSLETAEQIRLTEKIIENNLSVRETEKWVQQYKFPKVAPINHYAEKVNDWSMQLSKSLDQKVSMNINQKGEGRVVIHFTSPQEVEKLIRILSDK